MVTFSKRVIAAIRAIPPGRVATYGQIARMAGNPRGARQVSRILHSCSDAHDLPWHRIIGAGGRISLTGDGFEIQKALLEAEGVLVEAGGRIDLDSAGF